MTLTTLDPVTALVVIDLQKGIVGLPTAHPIDRRRRATPRPSPTRSAGTGCRSCWSTSPGGAPGRTQAPPRGGERPADWAELAPELGQQPSDLTVTKRTWGAFHGTSLDADLRALGVTQVVVAGISTSIGVESTARERLTSTATTSPSRSTR